MVKNILSVDVEEIFHIEYARHTERANLDFRTPKNIRSILDFFNDRNVVATFFIVGEIAEKFPEVIEMIEANGHEVAFHGWSHLPLRNLDAASFRKEVVRFKEIYPRCVGYRAPSFSLNNDTRWALKILQENGFRYDSSIFPARTPLYGVSEAPMRPHELSLNDVSKENDSSLGIYEFPLAAYDIFGLRIPIAGGFWLRLWDIRPVRRGIRKLSEKGFPAVIFIHNWELDPETPRLRLNPYRSFVTYYNIEKTVELFKRLLHESQFTSFAEYMETTGMI